MILMNTAHAPTALNGTKIQKYLNETGTSYEELAIKLGVSPSLVRQMAKGYIPARKRDYYLTMLASILGVKPASLLV